MLLRRTLVLTIGAILPFALTGCVKEFATDRVNTISSGVDNRDAFVDVLHAVIVSSEAGSGTFIASFANNDTEEPASFTTLEGIDLAEVRSQGYCFQIDLTWRSINHGFVVVEVPITFTEREFGQSKMSGSNIREALFKVAGWGLRGRIDRARGARVTR